MGFFLCGGWPVLHRVPGALSALVCLSLEGIWVPPGTASRRRLTGKRTSACAGGNASRSVQKRVSPGGILGRVASAAGDGVYLSLIHI